VVWLQLQPSVKNVVCRLLKVVATDGTPRPASLCHRIGALRISVRRTRPQAILAAACRDFFPTGALAGNHDSGLTLFEGTNILR